MSLMRVAFDGQDNIIRLVVLCPGCLNDLVPKVTERRRWIRPMDGSGMCEFCEAEVREAAGSN